MTQQTDPRWTEYMPLDDVLRAPRNPKAHAHKIIAASMQRFGVVELPALDERTGRLVAGHGRLDDWQATRASGGEPPDGVKVDPDGTWYVPVSRGWASADDTEAEAYLITSNTSTISGGWNDDELEEMLAEIAIEDLDLAQVTGYSAATLEDIISAYETSQDQAIDGAAAVNEFLGARSYVDLDVEHDTPPRTEARYAETPEQEAERSERVASYQPRTGPATGGAFVEMILVYSPADRDEVARQVSHARSVLGPDLKGSDIVLRALRVLSAVLDNRNNVEPVTLGPDGSFYIAEKGNQRVQLWAPPKVR